MRILILLCFAFTISWTQQSDSIISQPPVVAPVDTTFSITQPEPLSSSSITSSTPIATLTDSISTTDTSNVQTEHLPEPKAETKEVAINIMDEFEIFGDDNQSSIFILGFDNTEMDKAVKEQIMLRSFSRDLFFMQNIDREEFEEQRSFKGNLYKDLEYYRKKQEEEKEEQ